MQLSKISLTIVVAEVFFMTLSCPYSICPHRNGLSTGYMQVQKYSSNFWQCVESSLPSKIFCGGLENAYRGHLSANRP